MKRFIFSCCFIVIIIIFAVFELHQVKEYNDTLIKKIDTAQELLENNKTDDALKKVEDIKRFWNKYYIKMSFIVQSSKLNEISVSVSKLDSLLKSESDEFDSECEYIEFSLRLIYDSQFPSLHSIV